MDEVDSGRGPIKPMEAVEIVACTPGLWRALPETGRVRAALMVLLNHARVPSAPAELRRRADHLVWEANRVIDYDANILREIERDLRQRANQLDPQP